MKLRKELIDKLDNEEITNLQCIKMHGQEMVDDYKEWCSVLDFEEGDEEGAGQFINEIRYGDEPDTGDWPDEVWDTIKKEYSDTEEENKVEQNVNEEWKKDRKRLNSLKTSENAVKIALWRYQNPDKGIKTCARELGFSKNTIKDWWNVPNFINHSIADGGHVHFSKLDRDAVKKAILEAVEKAEQDS